MEWDGESPAAIPVETRLISDLQLFGGHVEETKVPFSIRATLQSSHPDLRHLVMVGSSLLASLSCSALTSLADSQVPGHAIWTGCDASAAAMDQDWILEEMQKGGDVRAYIKHITKGFVRSPSFLHLSEARADFLPPHLLPCHYILRSARTTAPRSPFKIPRPSSSSAEA